MSFPNPNVSLYKNVELESKVAGANPHQLIQMLFDELHVLLARAKASHLRNDTHEITQKNAGIEKAVNILSYLHQSLSEESESNLPHNLGLLYEYMVRQLLSYRLKNELQLLDEVDSLVETISTGWRGISGGQS